MKHIFKKKRIYLDYAAATPLDPRVFRKMKPYWHTYFGNPGGIHAEGVCVRETLERSREAVARNLSVKAKDIIFTSGGTESNNLALMGYISSFSTKEDPTNIHVLTLATEHPSILETCKHVEKKGVSVTYLEVNEEGIVTPQMVREKLTPQTRLVSISYVNSEIGTIAPIRDIRKVIRGYEKKEGTRIVFHTDASQAPLYFDCSPEHLGVELLTLDAQKIYGPKGVGVLYKNAHVDLEPIMYGGSQESGMRPGTENTPLIVGMSEALHYACEDREEAYAQMKELQEYFLKEVESHIPRAVLNGSRTERSPNNINISIPHIDSEYLVVALDEHGIAAATKSACLGYSKKGSYVITSLKKGTDSEDNALRFSMGRETTKRDIDRVISVLVREITKLDKVKF